VRLRIGIAALGVGLLLTGMAAGAAPRPTVLGVSWEATGMLARLDALTLRPVGRRLDIGKPPVGLAARSPDGRTMALRHGSIPELRFVDLRAMRQTGRLRLGSSGWVPAAIWPSPTRLVLLLGGEKTEVVVVDPNARRVVSRQSLDGELAGSVAAGSRLLALLAPRRAIGPARLAVVAADGMVRVAALPGVAAGFAPPPNPEGIGRQESPGFAADPTGRRAVVVTPDALLTVDLGSLEVTSVKRLERRPARAAKRIEGWGRHVLWLQEDTIAVAGWDISSTETRVTSTPIGATLVELGTGTRRELDSGARGIVETGGTLLAFGGSALRGYDLGGRLRFELLPGGDTGYVQTSGRYAYVGSENSTRFTVVDVRAGRVLGTTRTPNPTIVLG